MASGEEEWLLYIDESGDFELDPCSCVIGIAIRERETPDFEKALRDAVEHCFPLVPWPPHTADLNLPISRAAACLVSEGDAPSLREATGPAITALKAGRQEDALVPFFDAVDAARWPRYEALAAADGWLRARHRAAWGRLDKIKNGQRRHFAQILAAITEHYGRDGVFVVGAAQRGDDVDARESNYLSCLEAALERLFALLRSRDGRRVVRFRVATRDEHEPRIGRDLPLSSTRVLEVARQAAAFPLGAPAEGERDAHVRLVPLEHITRFDRHVKPGIVLADFLANRLRHVLGRDEAWAAVRRAAREQTRVSPERVCDLAEVSELLPTIAHDGEVRVWLARALGSDVPTKLGPTLPRWAREQAEAWAGIEVES